MDVRSDRRLASIVRSRTRTPLYVALDLDVLDPSEVDVLIPEPTACRRTRSSRSCATSRGTDDDRGHRRHRASLPRIATLHWPRGCSRRLASEPRTSIQRMSSGQGRVDVEVESKRPDEPASRRGSSQHVPRLRVALPRRRARADASRLPAVRPPLPRARARAHRAARRSRDRSARRTTISARPTRSSSSICVRTPSGSPRRRSRPVSATRSSAGRRRSKRATASSRSWTSRSWAARWGASSARSSCVRASARRAPAYLARVDLGVGRRAHAGRHPRAHAAPEDDLRDRRAPRVGRRDDLRAHASDDRRRARELREPR